MDEVVPPADDALEPATPEAGAPESSSPPVDVQAEAEAEAGADADRGEPGAAATAGPKTPWHRLDPRHVRADQIAGLVFAASVTVGMAVALLISLFTGGGISALWLAFLGGAALVSVFLVVLGIVWPILEHRYSRWRFGGTGLEIRRGVLWRHDISIPFARVQHADVSQGPLQRQFGLSKLTVHTAGTQNASVELTGLAHPTAIALRDEVIRQRKALDVV